jgi:two-component system, chemotaxis family, CheB/CheR fusion protein
MQRRILVVDDYIPAAAAITRLLRLCGHRVLTATAGRDVIRLALEFHPDVILLDLTLGDGEDGLEIAARIRVHAQLGDTVLVALTGNDDEGQPGRVRAAGFDYLLIKPASLSMLESIIGASPALAARVPRQHWGQLTPLTLERR